MKISKVLIIVGACITLVSCNLASEALVYGPEQLPIKENTIIETREPNSEPTPEESSTNTPAPEKLEIDYSDPDQIMYDFTANMCQARWTNNGQN